MIYMCIAVFSATHIDEELDNDSERHSPYGSTFRTFDATNYAAIGMIMLNCQFIMEN